MYIWIIIYIIFCPADEPYLPYRRACMDKPTWLQTLAKLYTNYDTHLVSVYPLRRIGMISQLYTNQNNCGSTMPPSHGTVDCKAHPVPFEKAPKTHVLPEIMFGLGLPDWKLSHTFVTQIVGSTHPFQFKFTLLQNRDMEHLVPPGHMLNVFAPRQATFVVLSWRWPWAQLPPKKQQLVNSSYFEQVRDCLRKTDFS